MKHCLIVDDSEIIRRVARNFIERLNYRVTEAETGELALKICTEESPDLILLDWQLPTMTALEFLTGLRLAHNAKRPFILYCTTENDTADLTRAFTAGADDYMIKPFDRADLEAKFSAAGLAA